MDANGLNFRMLSTASDWLPQVNSDVLYYCTKSNRLQLRSRRLGKAPVEDFSAASALVETTPMTRDQFGNYARWDPANKNVTAGGSASGEIVIYTPPSGQTVTDLAMGFDGVLYIAVAGTLVLVDRENRWPNFTLSVIDFNFWRLIALPQGGVLALDRTKPQLGTVAGLPLQVEPSDTPDPDILRSCAANPEPPQIVSRYPLPSGETFVAFAAMSSGQFGLISWAQNTAANTKALLRVYTVSAGLTSPWTFTETVFPYGIAWLAPGTADDDSQRLAILATGLNEALIYDLQGSTAKLVPAGDTYILAGANSGPFAHVFDTTPYYARGASLFPLLPLSLNSLAPLGATDPTHPIVIDSGTSQMVWHRLFLEAILPPRCGALVWLSASNSPAGLATWYPHVFGAVDSAPLPAETPSAAWLPIPSEVAFARPLLGESPVKNVQGLFMVLVQTVGTAVRNLSGRYLGIRIQLNGDIRSTPEIAALRIYGSRYSYVNNYLPELYRENKFGPDALAAGESTRRDFFERFVNIFEAQMTRIEDRIANSYLLTRPESTPGDSLDWLGGWVGVDFTGYPPDRKRARLLATPGLYKKRGTVGGISQALDVATNGMCSRGAILVVEDFRLRHIFATILGADLADNNDPLLPGYSASSNSFVGDTLFLGDPRNPDFLALFTSTVLSSAQQEDVQQFLDTLAYRITVFIHNQVEAVDVNLVQQIVEQEKPAHVAATFLMATQPFMIGLASLLGVNSYLAPEPPLSPAVVDVSRLGRYDTIQHAPSLDPRWENGEPNA
ncbi:MAG TPA: phage tail protein [Bryobacteraceae bacterium]|nr:phage tail protein [Bryobacteraceae bacterium]